jgi:hypothetical protein
MRLVQSAAFHMKARRREDSSWSSRADDARLGSIDASRGTTQHRPTREPSRLPDFMFNPESAGIELPQ